MGGMQEPGSQSSQRPYDDLPCAEGAERSTERLTSSFKVTQPAWSRSEIYGDVTVVQKSAHQAESGPGGGRASRSLLRSLSGY